MIENPGQKRQFHTLYLVFRDFVISGFFRKMQSFSESTIYGQENVGTIEPLAAFRACTWPVARLYAFTSDRAAYALQLTPERQKRGLKPATTLGEPF